MVKTEVKPFQSTPSVGRATSFDRRSKFVYDGISIHALRGEGDVDKVRTRRHGNISIHALRGEGDPTAEEMPEDDELFQSTPSVGRATMAEVFRRESGVISIHALRGEGDLSMRCFGYGKIISIHALRGEGDFFGCLSLHFWSLISIHALRGEGDVKVAVAADSSREISIHALRGEGDIMTCIINCNYYYFNPRPPWGGRRINLSHAFNGSIISIHALRGEGDVDSLPVVYIQRISIHALRGEGDLILNQIKRITRISIHALRGEGDTAIKIYIARSRNFNPRPPWGGRHWSLSVFVSEDYFNPRPPWGGRRRIPRPQAG